MDIKTVANEWKSMSGSEAEDFYNREVFPAVKESFLSKLAQSEKERLSSIKYLIMTVGGSPQPLILLLEAIKPDYAFFLCSKETENEYEKIMDPVNGIDFLKKEPSLTVIGSDSAEDT